LLCNDAVAERKAVALTELDRNLLKRCLARDPDAWKDFVDRFGGLFVHVVQHTAHARSLRLAGEDADDFVSDIFVAIVSDDFGVLRRFRGKSSLATYLTVIARRITVQRMAHRRAAEALGHVSAHGATNATTESADDREQVKRLLAELDERSATAVRMSFLEGKSYREIAAALNIAENSVGPMLTRAKQRLAEKHVQS